MYAETIGVLFALSVAEHADLIVYKFAMASVVFQIYRILLTRMIVLTV